MSKSWDASRGRTQPDRTNQSGRATELTGGGIEEEVELDPAARRGHGRQAALLPPPHRSGNEGFRCVAGGERTELGLGFGRRGGQPRAGTGKRAGERERE